MKVEMKVEMSFRTPPVSLASARVGRERAGMPEPARTLCGRRSMTIICYVMSALQQLYDAVFISYMIIVYYIVY